MSSIDCLFLNEIINMSNTLVFSLAINAAKSFRISVTADLD